MPQQYRVVFLGFSAFERRALGSYLLLGTTRPRARYEQVQTIAHADFVVADADHPESVADVIETRRLRDTVFVGSQPPHGAAAWMLRPIDPSHVMRELDALAAARGRAEPASMAWPPAPTPTRAPAASTPRPQRRAYDSEPGALDALPPERTLPLAPPRRVDVLMIDDSDIALLFLERRLHTFGLDCQRANDSATALHILERESFSFVFVDVELGAASDLDGLALCRHIKQRTGRAGRPAPVVVMLSAYASPADRVRGMLAGCDAYLAKPLDDLELRRTLLRHGAALAAPNAPSRPAPL